LAKRKEVFIIFYQQPRRLRVVVRIILAVLIFLIGALDACAAPPSLSTDSASTEISVMTIQKGNFSGIREPLQ
jgi:hypothetical protein